MKNSATGLEIRTRKDGERSDGGKGCQQSSLMKCQSETREVSIAVGKKRSPVPFGRRFSRMLDRERGGTRGAFFVAMLLQRRPRNGAKCFVDLK